VPDSILRFSLSKDVSALSFVCKVAKQHLSVNFLVFFSSDYDWLVVRAKTAVFRHFLLANFALVLSFPPMERLYYSAQKEPKIIRVVARPVPVITRHQERK
jgi:hypothetical protein